MKLVITGNPKKVDKEVCREACFFFAEKLMSSRVLASLHVDVKFESNLFKRVKFVGQAYQTSSEVPPRDFEITIDDNMAFRRTMKTLAHELVHVKQFAIGELHDYVKHDPLCRWQKEVLNPEEIDYWDQPWEIEAYGRDIGLYERFMIERRREARKRYHDARRCS